MLPFPLIPTPTHNSLDEDSKATASLCYKDGQWFYAKERNVQYKITVPPSVSNRWRNVCEEWQKWEDREDYAKHTGEGATVEELEEYEKFQERWQDFQFEVDSYWSGGKEVTKEITSLPGVGALPIEGGAPYRGER